jgi:hypothetical protein
VTCRSSWNCFIQRNNITVQNSALRLCFLVSFYGPKDEFRNIHWAHIYRVLLFFDYSLSSLPATIPPHVLAVAEWAYVNTVHESTGSGKRLLHKIMSLYNNDQHTKQHYNVHARTHIHTLKGGVTCENTALENGQGRNSRGVYACACAFDSRVTRVVGRLHLKCDGTRAETRFGLSAGGGVSSVDYWQPRYAHQR